MNRNGLLAVRIEHPFELADSRRPYHLIALGKVRCLIGKQFRIYSGYKHRDVSNRHQHKLFPILAKVESNTADVSLVSGPPGPTIAEVVIAMSLCFDYQALNCSH